MALKTGLASQFGVKAETTAGVPVVVDTFIPILSETLDRTLTRLASQGIRAGRRMMDTEQRNGGLYAHGGSVSMELYNRGLATWFKLCMGTVNTTGSGPYTHTVTPGDLPSFTAQAGVPDITGTVHPKTVAGCKVGSWEMGFAEGEIVTFSADVVGMRTQIGTRQVTDGVLNETTTLSSANANFTKADLWKSVSGTGIPADTYIVAVASNGDSATMSAAATSTASGVTVTIGRTLASASYPADLTPIKCTHGTVTTLGGSAIKVKSGTLSVDNALADPRYFLGDENPAEHLEGGGLREVSGELTLEFTGLTQYERYVNGTFGDLVLGFTSGTDSITTTAHVQLDAGTPQANSMGIIEVSYPFMGAGDGSDADGLTVVLVNSDSTA